MATPQPPSPPSDAGPIRSCVACRLKRPKRTLLRVSRTKQGIIACDLRQVAPGRGVYLCGDARCLSRARAKGLLARALKHAIPAEVWEALERVGAGQTDHYDDMARS